MGTYWGIVLWAVPVFAFAVAFVFVRKNTNTVDARRFINICIYLTLIFLPLFLAVLVLGNLIKPLGIILSKIPIHMTVTWLLFTVITSWMNLLFLLGFVGLLLEILHRKKISKPIWKSVASPAFIAIVLAFLYWMFWMYANVFNSPYIY